MREIKFRAWDKKSKQMYYQDYGDIRLGILNLFEDGKVEPMIDEVDEYFQKIAMSVLEDAELMQFTGLKNKNGKEIYEGDVLKWFVSTTKRFADEPLLIEWGSVGWVLKSPLFKSFGISANNAKCSEVNTIGYTEDCEVVGNIYENPELLEVKE